MLNCISLYKYLYCAMTIKLNLIYSNLLYLKIIPTASAPPGGNTTNVTHKQPEPALAAIRDYTEEEVNIVVYTLLCN